MSTDSYNVQDFVLNVSQAVNPAVWDESKYEGFLDELCQAREYQKDAIRTVLRYLLAGRYSTLAELAKENHTRSASLQTRWPKFATMRETLQLPDKLACSVDLATSTGKSYLLYGIACILLAEGAVDRVLLLCPSKTIEFELTEKFKALSANGQLHALLPDAAVRRAPLVVDANSTVPAGAICVENYHAVLETVKSSIRDSFAQQGQRTLVLNDEVHHVFTQGTAEVKRWKEFLTSEAFRFKYIVGVSGTCYLGDEYFSNVVYRYSLRQAIEDGFVKQVEYVAEMPAVQDDSERWQLVYSRHQSLKAQLASKGIRPLTIVVCADIRSCKATAEELQGWLEAWESRDVSDESAKSATRKLAREKVIAVTSDKAHLTNLAKLRGVDSSSSPVEWIVSVSMLSEGWDVKNVFQIVPHEDRAFNSKLLIAQVLGRGLRRPVGWVGPSPVVTVFNHAAWSASIKTLVQEVLEIDKRISCVVDGAAPFNFELHQLKYTRVPTITRHVLQGQYRLFEAGYVDIASQLEREEVEIRLQNALATSDSEGRSVKAMLEHQTYSAEEVAAELHGRLSGVDLENAVGPEEDRTDYASRYSLEYLREVVDSSLRRVGILSGMVTEANRQKFLQALGTLKRKSSTRVTYVNQPGDLVVFSTSIRERDSVSAAELKRGKSIFFHEDSHFRVLDEQATFFEEVTDLDGPFASRAVPVQNAALFKTPTQVVIADSDPERKFIRLLVGRECASQLDGWVKNKATGFYSVEYSWKKGSHTKRGEFSPDFFLKAGKVILVVEIKDDGELEKPAEENVRKFKYSVEHFDNLNEKLASEGVDIRYQFNMLTPKDYPVFAQYLKSGRLLEFRSNLDVVMAKQNRMADVVASQALSEA